MRGDPGLEVVEHVRDAFDPGEQWCANGPRGFMWWPAAFAQRIESGGVHEVGGGELWRVQAELELVRGVEGTGPAFARIAAWNALNPGLSALRWNGDARTVSLCSTVYVRAGEWERGARELASAALLQLADAARDGAALALDLQGEPAESAPPGGEKRAEGDELLEGWRRFAEVGGRPTPFDAARLNALAAMPSPPWTRVHVDAAGLHAELPCALPGEAQPGSAPRAGVALLHLLIAQPHPRLGAGVIAALALPPDAEPVRERMVATSALLNEAEARESTLFDGTGAWCFHPAAGLAFVTFVPALLDAPRLLEHLVWTQATRARWVRGFLARVATLRGDGAPG